jgi:hypothetical protein
LLIGFEYKQGQRSILRGLSGTDEKTIERKRDNEGDKGGH